MYKRIGLLVLPLLLFQFTFAVVLQVPSSYTTVNSAMLTASAGDTILLATGTYSDTVNLRVSITFASNYIFTGDTSFISQTVWQSNLGRAAINPNYFALALGGITFQSANNEIVRGNTMNFTMDHCNFSGRFDPTNNIAYAAISLNPTNAIPIQAHISNSTFVGASNSVTPWLSLSCPPNTNSYAIITDCSVSGRSSQAVTPTIYSNSALDSIIIRRCTFHCSGKGVWVAGSKSLVDSCEFVGLTDQAVIMLGSPTSAEVSNCRIDSVINTNLGILGIVEFFSSFGQNTVRNCTFSNITDIDITNRDAHFSIIEFQNSPRAHVINCEVSNCYSRELVDLEGVDTAETGSSLDSCRIHDNHLARVIWATVFPQQFSLQYCDFDRITLDSTFDRNVISVVAPNCWWGSSSGPNYSGNSTGQGLALSNNVNPVPWRTSPVFPEDGVSERGTSFSLPTSIELLPAYPNPFNSDVTIRYTLPKAEPAVVKVWNEFGQLVTTLNDARLQSSGNHSVRWSPNALASGRYFVRVNTPMGRSGVMSMAYVK